MKLGSGKNPKTNDFIDALRDQGQEVYAEGEESKKVWCLSEFQVFFCLLHILLL